MRLATQAVELDLGERWVTGVRLVERFSTFCAQCLNRLLHIVSMIQKKQEEKTNQRVRCSPALGGNEGEEGLDFGQLFHARRRQI